MQIHFTTQLRVEYAGKDDAWDYEGVALREGVFTPGIGNPDGERVRITRAFIERYAASMEGKHFDLDHSTAKADMVGEVVKAWLDEEGALRVALRINDEAPKAKVARERIEAIIAADGTPNLSVEILGAIAAPLPKGEADGATVELVMADGFDGVALVEVGACSDLHGCGIGLNGGEGLDGSEEPSMSESEKCGCGNAGLVEAKAALTSLEAEKAKMQERIEALEGQVSAYEAQEVDALQTAVKESLPEGVELKDVVGEDPSKEDLEVALRAYRAFAASKQQEANKKMESKKRQGFTQERTASLGFTESILAKYGLKESPLPKQMQRNTERGA